MRIILTLFWVAIGAVLLWFFVENLDQNVTIDAFGRSYQNVNLVTVMFASTLAGLMLGILIMIWQVIKGKAQIVKLRKELKKLSQELQNLQQELQAKLPEVKEETKPNPDNPE